MTKLLALVVLIGLVGCNSSGILSSDRAISECINTLQKEKAESGTCVSAPILKQGIETNFEMRVCVR